MRLTTKGRYAVTAMLDMALQTDGLPVTLAGIAQRQSISLAYLEQLFVKLRRAELVTSVRGAQGGYRLARAATAISIYCILAAVDDSVDATRCDGEGNCQEGVMCLAHDLWSDLSQQMEQYLSTISLQDMIERQTVQQVYLRQAGSVPLAATAATAPQFDRTGT